MPLSRAVVAAEIERVRRRYVSLLESAREAPCTWELRGKRTVETLRGAADVTIPPGTSSGAVLRLRGQGIREGDHLVHVLVQVPGKPTDEEKALYGKLRGLSDG